MREEPGKTNPEAVKAGDYPVKTSPDSVKSMLRNRLFPPFR